MSSICEPALLDRDVEDVPRQDLVEVVGAQVRLLRNALGLEGLRPEVVAEVLGPAVEAHARLPRRVQDAPRAPVAAREHALDLGFARLVPLHLRAAHVAELFLQVRELALEDVDAVEGRPLEGRPGLRHEGADGDVDVLAAVLPSLREDARDELDELVEVGGLLGRQADHRVDLDQVPTAREGDVGRLDHVVVGERLVDDAAQPVRARLGREREAGLADFRHGVGQAHREGLRAQRGQRDRHPAVGELRRQALHERLDLRVVGGREREQADLAPARLGDELLRHVRHVARIELAHRPVPVAGLAEAAALRAAAHDLEAEAVLHDLDRRDHRLVGVVLGLERRHPGALGLLRRARVVRRDRRDAAVRVVRHVVERRHVDALDLREVHEQLAPREPARAAVAVRVEEDRERVLGVADEERVEEVRDRLAVGRARARRRARSGPTRAARAATPAAPRGRACSGCSSSSAPPAARTRARRSRRPGRTTRSRRAGSRPRASSPRGPPTARTRARRRIPRGG